jgi:hypothetical protein
MRDCVSKVGWGWPALIALYIAPERKETILTLIRLGIVDCKSDAFRESLIQKQPDVLRSPKNASSRSIAYSEQNNDDAQSTIVDGSPRSLRALAGRAPHDSAVG